MHQRGAPAADAHLRREPGQGDARSSEFEQNFLEVLSRRHGTKRVHSNVVYQEYIQDKQHVHMNSTKWETLTNFILYLGKSGKAVVDETEKGWYLAWIDRDPAAMAKQAALERKRKHDADDETRKEREIRARRGRARVGPRRRRRRRRAADGARARRRRRARLGRGRRAAALEKRSCASAASRGSRCRRAAAAARATPARAAAPRAAAAGDVEPRAADGAGPRAQADEQRRRRAGRRRSGRRARGPLAVRGHRREGHVERLADGRYCKRKAVVEGVVDRARTAAHAPAATTRAAATCSVDQTSRTVIPAVGAEVLLVNGRARGARPSCSASTSTPRASVRLLAASTPALRRVEYEDATRRGSGVFGCAE